MKKLFIIFAIIALCFPIGHALVIHKYIFGQENPIYKVLNRNQEQQLLWQEYHDWHSQYRMEQEQERLQRHGGDI